MDGECPGTWIYVPVVGSMLRLVTAVAVALARGIGDGVLAEPVVVGHAPHCSRRRPTATTTGARATGDRL